MTKYCKKETTIKYCKKETTIKYCKKETKNWVNWTNLFVLWKLQIIKKKTKNKLASV